MFGDTVKLMADVTGVPEGASVTFDIYDTSENPPMVVASAKGKNEKGVAKGEWVVTDTSGKGADAKLAFEGVVKSKVSGRAEIQIAEMMVVDVHYEDKKGNKLTKLFPKRDVNLIVKTQNLQGKSIDIDLSDSFIDFEYNGEVLENDILRGIKVVKDEMTIDIRTVRGKK
jgi:hypothetical protein